MFVLVNIVNHHHNHHHCHYQTILNTMFSVYWPLIISYLFNWLCEIIILDSCWANDVTSASDISDVNVRGINWFGFCLISGWREADTGGKKPFYEILLRTSEDEVTFMFYFVRAARENQVLQEDITNHYFYTSVPSAEIYWLTKEMSKW